MSIVLFLHSLTRWLVILTAVVAIVAYVLVLLNVIKANAGVKRLMRIFTSVLSLQFVLGILVLLLSWSSSGNLVRYQMEHATIGFIAVAIGHASAMWRKRDPNVVVRNNLIDIVVVLIVIYVGVALLPGGWSAHLIPTLG